MGKKWFFFDFDGTLIDTSDGFVFCMQSAAEKTGIGLVSDEGIKKVSSLSLNDMIKKLYPSLDDETRERLFKTFREEYKIYGVVKHKIYSGIEEILRFLYDKGAKLHIVSLKPQIFLEEICSQYGIDRYFTSINGTDYSSKVNDKKELLQKVLLKNNPLINSAYMIGDTTGDIKAANINRIKSIAVGYGYGDFSSNEFKSDYFCDSVEGLKLLLEKICFD